MKIGIFLFILAISSAVSAQIPDTDIWLISLNPGEDGGSIKEVTNITHRTGYDNQPHFLAGGRSLLYTSIHEEGQADVFQYLLSDQSTLQITSTQESEYSPTSLKTGKKFYTLQVSTDSAQSVWIYSLTGKGKPRACKPFNDSVGYFCKIGKKYTVEFVLGEPNQLRLAEHPDKYFLIAKNPGRCILPTPGKENSITWVQKGDKAFLMETDLSTLKTIQIAELPEGTEDFAFLPDGTIVLGLKGIIQKWNKTEKKWMPWLNLAEKGIPDFYRITVSDNGNEIAVVSFIGKKP